MLKTIAFTTYSNKTKYAQASLSCISKWKNKEHQLIVTCHDASEEMVDLLEYYKIKNIIDKLIYTESNFGHIRSVNLCLENSAGEYFFNINHDMLIKDARVIDDCEKILKDKKNGMVGWFWVGKGCYWEKENLKFTLRSKKIKQSKLYDDPSVLVEAMKKNNIKNIAPDESWVWCCNTSFFGIKTNLFKSLGGFNCNDFIHGYADDYLTYQLLEKKLNVLDIPRHLYNERYFDTMSICKWHDLGIKYAKRENIPIDYLVRFL